jgi:hypothetical protein
MTRSTIKIGTKKNKQDVYTFRTCLSSLNTSSVFLADRGGRRDRERERKREWRKNKEPWCGNHGWYGEKKV